MSLPRAGLPIGEYCSIETFDDTLHDGGSCIVVDLFLSSLHFEDLIEGKFISFSDIFLALVLYGNGSGIQFLINDAAFLALLFFIKRPESADDFDISCRFNEVCHIYIGQFKLLNYIVHQRSSITNKFI